MYYLANQNLFEIRKLAYDLVCVATAHMVNGVLKREASAGKIS